MKLNLERPLLFFDIESTGLNIATDAIAELSFVKVFPDGEERIKTWRVKPWDYAAGSLIVEEAGGRFMMPLAGEEPDFDRRVRQSLDALTALETAGETSLDRTADTFAGLLSAAAADQTPDSRRRAMEQTLYHVGRFIYILDAWDDLTEDLAGGGYNPVAARYGLTRPPLPETAAGELETTLTHSRNLAGAAFELLPDNPWTGTVRNIIAWGMPAICGEVRSGRYKKSKNRRGNKSQ